MIGRAWAGWLNDRLEAEVGRPRSAELRAAVDAIAKRLILEDLEAGLPSRELTGARAD